MSISLSSFVDKSRVVDLIKAIAVFLLFPKLDTFNKNNLTHAIDRLDAEARKADMNVSCKFAQDITGETEIVIKIKFGAQAQIGGFPFATH